MSEVVQPSAEQAEMMKKVLFDTFMGQYRELTQFVNRLPIAPQLKQIIIKHFDDGFLWTKEAFTLIAFAAPPAPEAPNVTYVPDLHIVEENTAVA